MADKAVMYVLSHCPTCIKAQRLFRERGIDYEERQVDDSLDYQNDVVRLSKQRTVPITVWPDGRVAIGIDGERG